MKLTNLIRDAFVRAAMQDVPEVDYSEQMRKLVMDVAIAALPPNVRAVWNDASLRRWVKEDWNSYHGQTVTHPTPDGGGIALPADVDAKLRELKTAKKAQEEHRRELERKLKGAAYAVTTRKALAALLPEFEKYLPADEPAAVRTLPVVANIVADFTKAGWPKDRSAIRARS